MVLKIVVGIATAYAVFLWLLLHGLSHMADTDKRVCPDGIEEFEQVCLVRNKLGQPIGVTPHVTRPMTADELVVRRAKDLEISWLYTQVCYTNLPLARR